MIPFIIKEVIYACITIFIKAWKPGEEEYIPNKGNIAKNKGGKKRTHELNL